MSFEGRGNLPAEKGGEEVMSKLNPTSIREANEHLRQLHDRIYELESKLQLQALHIEEVQRKNIDLNRQLRQEREDKKQALAAKEEEKVEAIERLEAQVQKLLGAAEERDAAMLKLESRSRLFYEVAEHRFALSRILEVLEEVSATKSRELLFGSRDFAPVQKNSFNVVGGDSLYQPGGNKESLYPSEGTSNVLYPTAGNSGSLYPPGQNTESLFPPAGNRDALYPLAGNNDASSLNSHTSSCSNDSLTDTN